jgi:hypothetical protein
MPPPRRVEKLVEGHVWPRPFGDFTDRQKGKIVTEDPVKAKKKYDDELPDEEESEDVARETDDKEKFCDGHRDKEIKNILEGFSHG